MRVFRQRWKSNEYLPLLHDGSGMLVPDSCPVRGRESSEIDETSTASGRFYLEATPAAAKYIRWAQPGKTGRTIGELHLPHLPVGTSSSPSGSKNNVEAVTF